jgi:hypothetical protein
MSKSKHTPRHRLRASIPWFTWFGASKVGRFTTAGSFTETTLSTANSSPTGIAAGPGDALWVTEYNANKIAWLSISTSIDCTQRPLAQVTPQRTAANTLHVTITTTTTINARVSFNPLTLVQLAAVAHTALQALRFGAGTSALIDGPGQPPGQPGSFNVSLSAGTQQTSFTVRPASADQPATVPLTVVDSCGEWPTLVGTGAARGN